MAARRTEPIPLIRQLGEKVEANWRRVNYDEHRLPSLAAETLASLDLAHQLSPTDIIDWVHRSECLPAQNDLDASFAQPPITLYRAPRLFISALFWLDATTEIHQHDFSGAFQVLDGSSIHGNYSFELEQRVNDRLLIGRVELAGLTLLERSAIQEIPAGSRYIHSLFHLDRPSVTLLVRSTHEPAAGYGYTYLRPWVAYVPQAGPVITRRRQTLRFLHHTSQADYLQMAQGTLGRADLEETLFLLDDALKLCDEVEFTHLLERAVDRHGPIVHQIVESVKEKSRLETAAKLRARVTGRAERQLLGVLLTAPNRSSVLEFMGQHLQSKDPLDGVVDSIANLLQQLGAPTLDYEAKVVVARAIGNGDSMPQAHAPEDSAAAAAVTSALRSWPLMRPLLTQ